MTNIQQTRYKIQTLKFCKQNNMKKVPSYPKITTKTNITFTQTQNININSPKSLAFTTNGLNPKKMFKSNNINGLNNLNTINNLKNNSSKFSRQRQKSNNSYINTKSQNQISQKSKQKIFSQKGSKSSAQLLIKRQNSSANLKLSKNYDAQNHPKHEQKKHEGKQQIKKLEQKLKILQKKIDTLKTSSSKRKKQSSASHRSRPKLNQNTNSSTNISQNHNGRNVEHFQKKKPLSGSGEGNHSSNKMLKKSYSDKNMLKCRPPKMPSHKLHHPPHDQADYEFIRNNEQQQQEQSHLQSPKQKHSSKAQKSHQHEQQVIHKFVTQVQKNPKMVQKHHHYPQTILNNTQKANYYVTNLVLSLQNTDYMIYKQHLVQSLHILNFLKDVRRPSLKQLEKHSVTLPVNNKHKYTLVLDLDQTLIHCNQSIDLAHDVKLKIKFPTGQIIDAGVNIRPHAIKLLKELSQICEIIVFTASHQCYANVVLDHLDPHKKYISHRLYRNHCWATEGGIYIKDLRILKKRDLQNVLLVDNAAYSYFYQLQNGIPIIPFYDDKQDQELLYLISYVKTLVSMKQNHKIYNTMKKANNQYFKLSEYAKFNDLEKLTKNLYGQNSKQFQEFKRVADMFT